MREHTGRGRADQQQYCRTMTPTQGEGATAIREHNKLAPTAPPPRFAPSGASTCTHPSSLFAVATNSAMRSESCTSSWKGRALTPNASTSSACMVDLGSEYGTEQHHSVSGAAAGLGKRTADEDHRPRRACTTHYSSRSALACWNARRSRWCPAAREFPRPTWRIRRRGIRHGRSRVPAGARCLATRP